MGGEGGVRSDSATVATAAGGGAGGGFEAVAAVGFQYEVRTIVTK